MKVLTPKDECLRPEIQTSVAHMLHLVVTSLAPIFSPRPKEVVSRDEPYICFLHLFTKCVFLCLMSEKVPYYSPFFRPSPKNIPKTKTTTGIVLPSPMIGIPVRLRTWINLLPLSNEMDGSRTWCFLKR